MNWPKLLVAVRHGESEGNIKTAEERTRMKVATHNFPLTQRGEAQAQITGNYLEKEFGEFDVYFTSYYARARQTLACLCPGVNLIEDARLAEGQRGIWHMMTAEQVALRFPEELERKRKEGLYHYRPWGGENWPDIELRIHSFLDTLCRDYSGQRVLVVAHGNWLIILEKILTNASIDEAMARYLNGDCPNASVTVYEGDHASKGRLALKQRNVTPWQGLV